MSWRTVVVSNTAKLDYKMDHMVIRQNDNTTKIHLSEISIVIIETTAVSMTAALLSELTKRKAKVVFCDEKRNPCAELVSYYGSHDTSAKVRKQIEWSEFSKKLVWTEIVAEKIRNQANFLRTLGKEEASMLDGYVQELQWADISNREGHAAKVYFNALFGLSFTRAAENPTNAALNYGYGIILSAFNREIVANGYLTQLGIFHDNMFNQFNLSSDLMEPFRILVDAVVYHMQPNKFEREEKLSLVNILNNDVFIDRKTNCVNNAIKIYCKSILDALRDNDISVIRFYRNEL